MRHYESVLTRFRRQRAGELYLGTEIHYGHPVYVSEDVGSRHMLIFGPTGGGKTREAANLICQRIDRGRSTEVIIDPHSNARNSLSHLISDHVRATRQEHRLIIIDPESLPLHGLSIGFDPLARSGFTPSVQAGLAVESVKRMHGDQAPTPLLVRWGLNVFTPLAAANLPFSSAEQLLDPADALYRRFAVRILEEQYPAVAHEWLHLLEHEHVGRIFSDTLSSLQNRIRALLSNESLRWTYATKQHCVDFERGIRERAIILVKCAPRKLLAKAEARMLGLQGIEATIKAAMNRSGGDPVNLTIDEAPVFSSPLLMDALDRGRGYNLRATLLAQSLNQFQDEAGGDYRFLSSVMNNARCRIIFGGSGPSDAETLAKLLWGAYLDPHRIKQEIYRTSQLSTVERVRTVTRTRGAMVTSAQLEGTSRSRVETQGENWSTTDSRGRTHGWSHAEGTSEGEGEAESEDEGRGYRRDLLLGGKSWEGPSSFNEGRGRSLSANTGTSVSDTDSESDTESHAETVGGSASIAEGVARQHAVTRGHAFSFSESEVETPMVFPSEPFQELSSREYMALAEQLYEFEAQLRRLPDQHAVLGLPGKEPIVFKTEFVPDPRRTPLELALSLDRAILHEAPWAVPLSVLKVEAKERDAAVRALLSPPPTRPSERRRTVALPCEESTEEVKP